MRDLDVAASGRFWFVEAGGRTTRIDIEGQIRGETLARFVRGAYAILDSLV